VIKLTVKENVKYTIIFKYPWVVIKSVFLIMVIILLAVQIIVA